MPPQREALAAALGGHLLRQRQLASSEMARNSRPMSPESWVRSAPLARSQTRKRIVFGPGGGNRGRAIGGERDDQDVALVAVAGEPRDRLSADDVPDADGAVAVPPPESARVPSRETARLTGSRGVAGQRPLQPRSAGGAGSRGRGRLGPGGRAGSNPASGAVAAARPNGERPIQSSHPPTPPASTTTARAAAATGRRVIRRR